jgi:phosphoenolpyruvate carboxykinase (GTP)
MSGLDVNAAAMEELMRVDIEGWLNEVPTMKAHFDKFGSKLPQGLLDELHALESRLASANATA